ncbi:hypothetical protein Ancab_001997 [Ancistrocladus abbreviatus]
MGRNIPMEEIPSNYYFHASFPSIYPTLTLSFHVAWMAVLVAIIGGQCGNRSKKTPPSDNNEATDNTATDENVTKASANESNLPQQTSTTTADQEETQKPLPPPPAAVALELEVDGDRMKSPPRRIDRSSTLHTYMSNNTSQRKLSGSISMRMSGAKSIGQRVEETKDDAQKLFLLKQEDSIWQKKILLGEKCRRDDDEADGGAAAASESRETASEAGSSAAAMSRSNSWIEDDAVSSWKGKMEEGKDMIS